MILDFCSIFTYVRKIWLIKTTFILSPMKQVQTYIETRQNGCKAFPFVSEEIKN
jgi:hypothetical protein